MGCHIREGGHPGAKCAEKLGRIDEGNVACQPHGRGFLHRQGGRDAVRDTARRTGACRIRALLRRREAVRRDRSGLREGNWLRELEQADAVLLESNHDVTC